MRLRNQSRVFALSLTTLLVLSGCAYFQNSQSKIEEAEVALEQGDEARAEQLYREAMRSKGKDSEQARLLLIDLLVTRGGRLLDAGKGDDAMPHYREALSLKPDHDASRLAYARALMKVERYTEAIDVLMEGKGCRGCKTMVAIIYLERGQAGIREGEYDDALSDFDMALSMVRDPLTVLEKVEVYIQGQHGTAMEAVGYLDQALRLMPVDQVGAQQVWWDKRTAVIYNAALAHDNAAISAALDLPDPRKKVSEPQRVLDKLNLRMYAASLQIYAKDYELGIERGLQTYSDADGAIPKAELDTLRQTLMGLFMQSVATRLAADEDGPARKTLVRALELDPQNRLLNYQNIIANAARSTSAARKLLAEWEGAEDYDRMRALVELAYVRKMLEVGQFTAAAAGLERAEKYAPELLDCKLVRAELEAQSRFQDMRKAWYESFRDSGNFQYPGGRVNYYGRSLAYLRAVQVNYDETAARDYLRMPAFQTRLDALEGSITGFYPYDAELAPADKADKAILLLQREESGEYELKIQGPRKAHVVKVAGESQQELELVAPGLAVLDTPGGPKYVFGEPGAKIIVKI